MTYADDLAVLTDLVQQIADRCPLDETISAVLRGYELAHPAAFDDEPSEGRSEPPSVRIAAAFSRRGLLIRSIPITDKVTPAQLLHAVPHDRFVGLRVVARRLGAAHEGHVRFTPDVRLSAADNSSEASPHEGLLRALLALEDRMEIDIRRVEHGNRTTTRSYRRRVSS